MSADRSFAALAGQRWAVTGAAGTIGRALRSALTDAGVTLVSLDIAETTPCGADDTVIRADLADLPLLAAAFEHLDGVVHLGGIADEADFHDLAEVNIVGTYHALEAARRARVPRFVHASSNRVTGMYDVDTLVDPSMPPRPDGFYGVSKVAGEALCRLYADKFALRVSVLRIGSYQAGARTERELRTWLSPADGLRAFGGAMTSPEDFLVFYAVSRNTERWWSLGDGEQTGFDPVDDAAADTDLRPLRPGTPQGGPYAAREYSLERMRDRE